MTGCDPIVGDQASQVIFEFFFFFILDLEKQKCFPVLWQTGPLLFINISMSCWTCFDILSKYISLPDTALDVGDVDRTSHFGYEYRHKVQ